MNLRFPIICFNDAKVYYEVYRGTIMDKDLTPGIQEHYADISARQLVRYTVFR